VDSGTDLFLVCNTDIPWMPDKIRENGGKMREILLQMYINEIESINPMEAGFRNIRQKN
jgi:hypothetical protein